MSIVGQFELSVEQEKKLKTWQDALPKLDEKKYASTIGGGTTYEFTPNGLGVSVVVKRVDGQEIDLTEYDKW